MNLGAHMSIAGGMHRALERGRSIGCNTVQLFVKNTNQWRARKLGVDEVGLGLAAFSFLVSDERFFDRPMVLETPKGPDDANDIRNLAVLRRLRRTVRGGTSR